MKKSKLGLQCYVDADNGGDINCRKSTSEYVYTFGGTAICWVSRLQKIITLSSWEAEYVAITKAMKEMIWLQTFVRELDQDHDMTMLCKDSQSATQLAKNSVSHARTKHIHLRYHFITSTLEDGVLVLEKIAGSQNPADILTKSVPYDKLKLCSTSIGLLT